MQKRIMALFCLALILAFLMGSRWPSQESLASKLPKHKVFAAALRDSSRVESTQFTVPRGFYDTATNVEMVCGTPGATIHYTMDGSEPKSTSKAYSEAVHIDHTTVLRAAAFKTGWGGSRVYSHTYIFPDDVIGSKVMRSSIADHPDYKSQIRDALLAAPSLSLVTAETIKENAPSYGVGKASEKKLVKASLEWLEPGNPNGFQEDCGVEYFGGSFTPFKKKSFRIHFRKEFGASKLKFPVFAGYEHGLAAVAEFDQLELRSGSHDMVQRGFYLSNLFADDSMLEMGHLNPHGRFVHLYLNGVYWGVFHLRERWGAGTHHRYLGGSSSDYESINGNLNVGGWAEPGVPYDGDGRTWARVHRLRGDYRAVKQWVDVPDYIDFMILWMYGRCEDEFRCVGPTVPGSGFQFYLNDADGFFQSPSHRWYGEPSNRTERHAPGRRGGDGPASLFSTLLAQGDPDFRTLLADQIHKAYFNDGKLTLESVANRLKVRSDELEKVFVVEAARWNYRTLDDWRSVRDDVVMHWLPTRAENVFAQMRAAGLYPSLEAPTLNQQGGRVTNGFQARFGNSRKASILYTLNGTDPRLPGGGVAPSVRRVAATDPPGVDTSIPIDGKTVVKSRAWDGNQWSALNTAFFQPGALGLDEGEVKIAVFNFDSGAKEEAEFVEVRNLSSQAVNLRKSHFTEGIEFAFADNRDTVLGPGQKLVLVKDLFQFRQQQGLDVAVEGIYSRKKKKSDRFITLNLETGEIIAKLRLDRADK
jgi:hypothetical protein